MDTHLYLIRHGEAIVNVERIVGGVKGCRGLTPRGHEQAARLGQRLTSGELGADVLYASTPLRARETAAYVAKGLELPIRWDDELQESRPGEADGLLDHEAHVRFGQSALMGPYHSSFPGGESQVGFMVRAGVALSRIVLTSSNLTAREQALRNELYDLYDRVLDMTEWVRCNTLNSVAYRNLTVLLLQLLM